MQSLLCLALVTSSHAFVARHSSPLQPLFDANHFYEDQELASEENQSQHEFASLDISQTTYTTMMKSPKDAYVSFAEKGAANANLPKRKIFHQSVLGGCYVGFGGLLA